MAFFGLPADLKAGHHKSPIQFLGDKFDLVTDFDQTQYKEIAALV